jgi:hypothetical protein
MLSAATPYARAQNAFVDGELWIEADALVADELPDARARAKALWELARWVFSGMVYGFAFEYRPLDVARGVADEFTVEPVGQLPWGDARLRCESTRTSGGASYARFALALDARLASYRAGWFSLATEATTGSGFALPENEAPRAGSIADPGGFGENRIPRLEAIGASFPEGPPGDLDALHAGKLEAIRIACRDALRGALRPRLRNKPRLIRGTFAFAEAPRLIRRDGGYAAVVKLRLIVAEVLPYVTF